MHNPRLCSLLLDHVRGLGFNVGRCVYADVQQGAMVCLDATDAKTGEVFTIRAPVDREYDAAFHLCRAVGIDLMDG